MAPRTTDVPNRAAKFIPAIILFMPSFVCSVCCLPFTDMSMSNVLEKNLERKDRALCGTILVWNGHAGVLPHAYRENVMES